MLCVAPVVVEVLDVNDLDTIVAPGVERLATTEDTVLKGFGREGALIVC